MTTQSRFAELWDPGDVLDSLWRIWASPYTTMLLLAALAILVVVGAVFPQRPAEALLDAGAENLWLASLRARYGSAADWLARIQVVDVYRSLWLRGVLGLLAFNLVLGAADWVRPRPHWPTGSVTETELRDETPPAADSVDSLFERAAGALRARRYRVWNGQNVRLVYADRFAAFALLFYLGLLLVLGGVALSERTAWWEDQVPLRPGQVRPLGHGTGLTIHVEAIEGGLSGGRTELAFLRADGLVGREVLYDKSPSFFAGLLLYQNSTDPVLVVKARDTSGRSLPLRTPEGGAAQATEVTLLFQEADGPRYVVVLDLGPSSQQGRQFQEKANEKFVLVPSRNLSLRLTYIGPGAEEGGPAFQVEAFRGSEAEPFYVRQFQHDESLQIGGDQYIFTPERHAVIKFGQDYAVALVLAGVIAAFVGMLLAALFSPRRVWLSAKGSSEQASLYLATAAQGSSGAPRWFSDLARSLGEALDVDGTETTQ